MLNLLNDKNPDLIYCFSTNEAIDNHNSDYYQKFSSFADFIKEKQPHSKC